MTILSDSCTWSSKTTTLTQSSLVHPYKKIDILKLLLSKIKNVKKLIKEAIEFNKVVIEEQGKKIEALKPIIKELIPEVKKESLKQRMSHGYYRHSWWIRVGISKKEAIKISQDVCNSSVDDSSFLVLGEENSRDLERKILCDMLKEKGIECAPYSVTIKYLTNMALLDDLLDQYDHYQYIASEDDCIYLSDDVVPKILKCDKILIKNNLVSFGEAEYHNKKMEESIQVKE